MFVCLFLVQNCRNLVLTLEPPYLFEDNRGILELVNLTRKSLRNDLLLTIHERAIRARTAQVLPEACKNAAQLKFHCIPGPRIPWDPVHAVKNIVRPKMDSSLPRIFGLTMDQDAHFAEMGDIFAVVGTQRMSARTWKVLSRSYAHFLKSLSQSVSGFMTAAPLYTATPAPPTSVVTMNILAMGAITMNMLTVLAMQMMPVEFYREKLVLIELALYVLVYERMLRYGMPNITREMAARAWIDVMTSLPEIEEVLEKSMSRIFYNYWEAVLMETVEVIRKLTGEAERN